VALSLKTIRDSVGGDVASLPTFVTSKVTGETVDADNEKVALSLALLRSLSSSKGVAFSRARSASICSETV
jgi:hypothetical protein